MEMHQLRYVVAVSRAGNFSRAAAQWHVSPRAVKVLETDFCEVQAVEALSGPMPPATFGR
jgi:hypothetical protein